jgi:hypothetical protein
MYLYMFNAGAPKSGPRISTGTGTGDVKNFLCAGQMKLILVFASLF